MVAHHTGGLGGTEGEVATAAGPPAHPRGERGVQVLEWPPRAARLCSARLGSARPGRAALGWRRQGTHRAPPPLRVCLTQRGRRGKSHLRPAGPGAAERGRSRARHPAAVPALAQRPPPGPRRRPAPARYYGTPSAPRRGARPGRAGPQGRRGGRLGAVLGVGWVGLRVPVWPRAGLLRCLCETLGPISVDLWQSWGRATPLPWQPSEAGVGRAVSRALVSSPGRVEATAQRLWWHT